MESIPQRVLYKIFRMLGTRDIARMRCVSHDWHWLLGTSFILEPHADAAQVVSGADGVEALMLYRVPGEEEEITVLNLYEPRRPDRDRPEKVFNLSVMQPMAGSDFIRHSYDPVHVCNGFVLFSKSTDWWEFPVILNPISGDVDQWWLPAFRTSPSSSRLLAMGYVAATRTYKLFGIGFKQSTANADNMVSTGYMSVITLCAGGEWRRSKYHFDDCHCMTTPPPLIAGELHVLAKHRAQHKVPQVILILDVATETHVKCSLPEQCCLQDHAMQEGVFVHIMDLHGQPCVAVHEVCAKIQFWVMRRCDFMWQLRYTFNMPEAAASDAFKGLHTTWFDAKGLHYIYGSAVYNYDTSIQEEECVSPPSYSCERDEEEECVSPPSYSCEWDEKQQLQLPLGSRCTVLSGYRPNFLSPQHLDITPQHVLDAHYQDLASLARVLRSRPAAADNSSDDKSDTVSEEDTDDEIIWECGGIVVDQPVETMDATAKDDADETMGAMCKDNTFITLHREAHDPPEESADEPASPAAADRSAGLHSASAQVASGS